MCVILFNWLINLRDGNIGPSLFFKKGYVHTYFLNIVSIRDISSCMHHNWSREEPIMNRNYYDLLRLRDLTFLDLLYFGHNKLFLYSRKAYFARIVFFNKVRRNAVHIYIFVAAQITFLELGCHFVRGQHKPRWHFSE